jgi:hypothetical protein
MNDSLDSLLRLVHKGGRAAARVDAGEVFRLAGLPEEWDDSVAFVGLGVYFHENLNVDRSMLAPGDSPEDYLVPQAPEFFKGVGAKRTHAVFHGAELSEKELLLFRAERACGFWSDWGGTTVRVYRIVASDSLIAYGAVTSSGGGYAYEESLGPLFAELEAVNLWARKLPNFYGWFPYGGGNLEGMIAAVRNPNKFPLKDDAKKRRTRG